VTLFYYLGLPVHEAALVMQCAPGTVKSTLSDARTRLESLLGEDYGS
jgi:DNA-directed RNA polymerase specialized sigma24 family protein